MGRNDNHSTTSWVLTYEEALDVLPMGLLMASNMAGIRTDNNETDHSAVGSIHRPGFER